MRLKHGVLAVLTFATAAVSHAQDDGQNVIYFGAGSAKNGNPTTTSNKEPMSIGYLRLSNASSTVWGIDVAGEGTMLDSTWGQNNAVKQATSFNALIGKNIGKTANSRYDAALIVGMREETSKCPRSYLGYQCYANSEPKTTYGFNYGLALTWTYNSLMLGVRATGESTQAMLGIRF